MNSSTISVQVPTLRLRSTAVGIVNNISKTVTDIYLKQQVTIQQHVNKIYYSERNKLLFKSTPTHSNQQLAALLKRFCAKLPGDCKEFDPEILSCTSSRYLLGQHLEDIWRFMYTFCNICGNLTALGVRNALRSIESSIQVQSSRFLQVPPC